MTSCAAESAIPGFWRNTYTEIIRIASITKGDQWPMALLVNGTLITDEEIAAYRKALAQATTDPEAAERNPRLQYLAEEKAVLQQLLLQEVERQEISISEAEIADELARRRGTAQSSICSPGERAAIARDLRLHRFVESVTRNVPEPARAQVEATYAALPSRFSVPESAHVRQIFVAIDELCTAQQAHSILTQAQTALHQGEQFETVADRFSDCAGVGGELGWMERGTMVEEFDEVVFHLLPGQTSNIFETRFGLHIAQLLELRAAGRLGFEEVREQLTYELHEDARQQALVDFLRGLATKADINIVSIRPRGAK
jgi:peptidyl-prolyl cis-trans isomerase C